MNEINIEEIKIYNEEFSTEEKNIKLATKIREKGIFNTLKNNKLFLENKITFNLKLPKVKMYDRPKILIQWISTGLRIVKPNIAGNLNVKLKEFNLSSTFILYYDLLEKVNSLYNQIIKSKKITTKQLNEAINKKINTNGIFHNFAKIVNKYGIVPEFAMKDVSKNFDLEVFITLIKEKVKFQIINKLNREAKGECLKEIVYLLNYTLGIPPVNFGFVYKNMQIESITPFEFKNQYLTLNIMDFVTVTSFDLDTLKLSNSYFDNMYMEDNEKIISLPTSSINKLITKQLKFGLPVYFTCELTLIKDLKFSILSDNAYLYEKIGVNLLEKEASLIYDSTNYDYAMAITGVNIENNKITRYRVENPNGNTKENKGFLTMYPSFFENYVITVIIEKKFIG